jgi:hypothetical protein
LKSEDIDNSGASDASSEDLDNESDVEESCGTSDQVKKNLQRKC